jgi:hypothetical protein
MPRMPALRCPDCRRRFGGDSTLRRHRVIAGDRFRCQPDSVLFGRGWNRDSAGVWHRPAVDQLSLLEASGRGLGRLDAGANGVGPTDPKTLARATDPITSKLSARAVAYRTGTVKARLLAAYLEEPSGLTDEEAAIRVGIELYQATKRCADLRNDGAIQATGVRTGRAGLARMVCRAVTQAVSA